LKKEKKEMVEKLLEEHYTFERMCEDLDRLSPKDRLGVFTGLIEYIIPKQQQEHSVIITGKNE